MGWVLCLLPSLQNHPTLPSNLSSQMKNFAKENLVGGSGFWGAGGGTEIK
jgi:hypothetical protein